jgi:hypothetical protein
VSASKEPLVPRQEQEPLYAAIANELVVLTPETWTAIVLDVSVKTPSGTVGMPHLISSPEGHREPISASDSLMDLTYKLLRLFEQHGPGWKSLRFEVHQTVGGKWHYECNFTYGP